MEEQGMLDKTEQEIQDWKDELVDCRQERDTAIKRILLRSAYPIIYIVAACILFVSGTIEWNAKFILISVILLITFAVPLIRYLIRYASIAGRIKQLESHRKSEESF